MIETSISSEPGHRVRDELEGGSEPSRAAPHADEDVKRNQHRLEHHVEEEEILRSEHADDRAGEQQHQAEVRARPLASDEERVADRGGHHDHGQPGEPEREAVHPDVIRDVQVAEPRRALLELEALREVEARERLDPEADLHERDEQREGAGRAAQRQHEARERAGDREEDQDRRQPGIHVSAPR